MECPPMTGQGGWEGEGLALVEMSGCKDDKVADQAPGAQVSVMDPIFHMVGDLLAGRA